ncbi:hypothetical protein [Rathayibacter sp. AY1E9]|uniref:hypothetical protein n=1 Tax=Rathayibacter sp. AY1E9 TaxID=2080556 RepID=UPI0011AFE775|nr:hypothetical protein [Rathayibacter sp. AY1E9]
MDVSNYRFAADQPSETAALNYLWTEDKVADVADLILRDGYVDNEQPLVVFEDGKYVVVEGNRRVSALMALNEPSLASAHQEDIERMLRRFAIEAGNLPQSIRVMVLPDRKAAAKILARLHTGQSKNGWTLDAQARFVMAQLTDDITLEELAAALPGIENVGRLVRMGAVRENLRNTTFIDETVTKYAHGARLKMSSFEYAYRQTTIRELIGLEFSTQARVIKCAATPSQKAALERLLLGFKNGELNTRRGLKSGTEAYETLLTQMRTANESETAPEDETTDTGTSDSDEVAADNGASDDGAGTATGTDRAHDNPGKSSADAGTSADAGHECSSDAKLRAAEHEEGGEPNADGDGVPDGRRGPNDPATRVNLNLTGIDEGGQPLTMLRRLRELRRTNVFDFPAAATMLMRSVLEAAIKEHYGRSNGIDINGELGRVMNRVRNDYQSNGQLSNAISIICRTGADATNTPGTGKWFNTVSHSVNVDVNGRQVHEAWLVVLPLVRFMLHETYGA